MSELVEPPAWHRSRKPFTYITAEEVLDREAYRRVEGNALSLVAKVEATRAHGDYDAAIYKLDAQAGKLLAPLFEPQWLSMVARSFDLELGYEIDAAIHDHPPDSRPGWIHNDFNPGRFPAVSASDEVTFSGQAGVTYRITDKESIGDGARLMVRRIAGIYYFGNEDWQPEHGGETGLYWSAGPMPREHQRIAPLDNSLVLFECGPNAYHRFLGTRRRRRSIVFWMHCTPEQAQARWPDHSLVYWR